MAPTVYEDDEQESRIHCYRNRCARHRHCSVINYVGRKTSNYSSSPLTVNDAAIRMRTTNEEQRSPPQSPKKVLNLMEYRCIIENTNREGKLNIDDDSMGSSSTTNSTLSFHNYSKRRKVTADIDHHGDSTSECHISTTTSDVDENSLSSMPYTPASTISSLYDNLSNVHQQQHCHRSQSSTHSLQLTRRPLPSSSPVSSTSDSMSLSMYCMPPATPTPTVHSFHQRALLDIAVKTIKLLQKNRLLQARLEQLQTETREFVDSVMSNPENAELRKQMKNSDGADTERKS